jgi:hypothetical protein
MAVFWFTELPTLQKDLVPASSSTIPCDGLLVENIKERHRMVVNINRVKGREIYITI